MPATARPGSCVSGFGHLGRPSYIVPSYIDDRWVRPFCILDSGLWFLRSELSEPASVFICVNLWLIPPASAILNSGIRFLNPGLSGYSLCLCVFVVGLRSRLGVLGDLGGYLVSDCRLRTRPLHRRRGDSACHLRNLRNLRMVFSVSVFLHSDFWSLNSALSGWRICVHPC